MANKIFSNIIAVRTDPFYVFLKIKFAFALTGFSLRSLAWSCFYFIFFTIISFSLVLIVGYFFKRKKKENHTHTYISVCRSSETYLRKLFNLTITNKPSTNTSNKVFDETLSLLCCVSLFLSHFIYGEKKEKERILLR